MTGPFKDHFSSLAAQYTTFRPVYPHALFDYLAGLCAARERAWDCACGNGQATVSLAARFAQVIGTDASAAQIEAARPHPQVHYRIALAESSGLDARSCDLVTVAQALHWLDLPRFYAEVRRVLRPGGVLAVWCYGALQVDAGPIDELLREFHYGTVGPYWPPERQLVEDHYRTIPFPFPETAPPSFSMRTDWSCAQLFGYLRSWSATARYQASQGSDPVTALEPAVRALWGPTSARALSWPLALRVGRL
jgi:SAM-dependent methyltransferase